MVKTVYNILTAENIPVWFDDRDMNDSMYDSMAEAVSNAAVICCFLSPEYENSENCRLELQHAQNLRKRIIPCMVSNRKVWKPSPSKWLGFITSSIIALDFSDSSEENICTKVKDLIGKIYNQPLAPTTQSISPPNKLFETIRQKYLRDNRIKRIVNEAKTFPIEQSYINLAMVESKEQIKKEMKLKEQDQYNNSGEDGSKSHSKKTHIEILGTYEEIYGTKNVTDVKNIFEKCKDLTRKILVLGRAGIGKSTFCRYISHQWAVGKLWPEYELLVLIQLRSLTNDRYPRGEKYSLYDLVQKEYLQFDDISEKDKQDFKEKSNKGHILWILDGYDEFAQNDPARLHLKDLFNHICDTQHHILTSRPYAITFTYDVNMEITGFTNDNITKYVEQFFDQVNDDIEDATAKRRNLLTLLQSNRSIWGVAHIPVNLELICSLWIDNDGSKKRLNMTALYDNIIEWLCRRHLTRLDEKYKHMRKKAIYNHCDRELRFLETFAFKAMKANKIMLPPTLLEETEDETEYCLDKNPELLNIGILKSYDDKATGNQMPTEKQHYFVHLSFQEHFAARYLLRTLKADNKKKAIHFIETHKYNDRFLLVFIFASGLLVQSQYTSCIDIFWSTLQGAPLDLIGLKHMRLVMQCLEEFGHYTVFQQRTDFLKAICNYLDTYIRSNQSEIYEYILRSFKDNMSLLNEPRIQKKAIQWLRTKDTNITWKILHMFSEVEVSEVQTELLCTILSLLQDPNSYVKAEACKVLGNLGKKATTTNEIITGLTHALRDEDWWVRFRSCEALGNLGEKAGTNEVIAGLMTVVCDADYRTTRDAYEALGNIGTSEVIAVLINAFRDKDWNVETEACSAFAFIGKKATANEAITALLEGLRNDEKVFKLRSCKAFQYLGEKAATTEVIDSLIDAVRDKHWQIRKEACITLGKLCEHTTPARVIAVLSEALQDEVSDVRMEACTALGNLDEKALLNDVISVLIAALLHEDPDVRSEACEAIRTLGEKVATNELIDGLVNALCDQHHDVRVNATYAIRRLGEKAATNEVITVFINAITDEDFSVTRTIHLFFSEISQKAITNEVIGAITKALRNHDSKVKVGACRVIEDLGEKAATTEIITALTEALRDEDLMVRIEVCEAHGSLGEKAVTDEVIATLTEALRDKDFIIRIRACEVLKKLGEKAAKNEVNTCLIEVLRDKHSVVRQKACKAVGKLGKKIATGEVITSLCNALQDEDSNVRREACKAFGRLGEKVATDEIIHRITNALRQDFHIREEACEALGRLREKAATNEVITELIEALRDEKLSFREAAFKALGMIGEKVTTNAVINALVNTILEKRIKFDTSSEHDALIHALHCNSALKALNSDMISELLMCTQFYRFNFSSMPTDHFLTAFLTTKNVELAPLVAYAGLLQGISITVVENSIRIYDGKGMLEFDVTQPKLMEALLEAFGTLRMEFGFELTEDAKSNISTSEI